MSERAYEAALAAYIDGVLGIDAFVLVMKRFMADIAPHGFRNSLAQLALKLTVPGVPDFYQGCEQWNFSLVDPDNRRPIDFTALASSLARMTALYGEHVPTPSEWQALLPACPGLRDQATRHLAAAKTAAPGSDPVPQRQLPAADAARARRRARAGIRAPARRPRGGGGLPPAARARGKPLA